MSGAAPDVRDAPLVGAPRARAGVGLSAVRARAGRVASGVEADRLRAPGETGRGRREGGQGVPVRLPDVRPVRAGLDRHVVPDELPEESAQRSLRRRARRRPLRGRPADAVRLGRGGRGQPAHARRQRRRSTSCSSPSTARLEGRSSWLAVAREKVWRPDMKFEDEPVPGYPLPILPGHTSPGRLERVLRAGAFAVTTELDPPDSADPEDVYRRARIFDGYVDAINATDGSGANCHMSSLAVCALLTRVGYAPVMQISCRDRNRIAIQGDILGGAAMGVCNMLCLTGDGVQAGDHPQARPVFDLDCMTLLDVGRTLRDEHRFQSGRKIDVRAARVLRRRRESVRAALRVAPVPAREEGRRRRAVHPDAVLLRRAAAARIHAAGGRPGPARPRLHPGRRRAAALGEGGGVDAHARARRPHPRRDRRADGGRRRASAAEGRRLCVELIQEIREIKGVAGVHVMAYRQEEAVAEIIASSGVLAGRVPWHPGRDSDVQPQRAAS